jgi:hypothetical protein
MNKFYHKLDFDVSKDAREWIIQRYKTKFKDHFYHHDDTIQLFSLELQKEWQDSLVGQEVSEFLSAYGCEKSSYSLTTFLCNTSKFFPGNPHVDFKFDRQLVRSPIKTRLNVMILGNPEDEMVWWDHVAYNSPSLIDVEFKDAGTGLSVNYPTVPGETKEDRLNFLGNPTCVAKDILAPSAFVKTDCAHTVNLSPIPRLVLTVALDKTIEELLEI